MRAAPKAAVRRVPQVRTGFLLAYRQGETNRCPGCGHSSWSVGRTTAECAFCGTVLPIVDTGVPDLRRFEQ